MYEELLIGDSPEPTRHASILRAKERFVAWDDLRKTLADLEATFEAGDAERAVSLMGELVPEYCPPLEGLAGTAITRRKASGQSRRQPPRAISASAASE